jgi:hypothetical protein
LLDFLDVQKRIYAKLTPKIQAHDRVTGIGTCLKSRCRFFLFAFPFSLAVGHGCFPTLTDGSFQVLGQLEYFNQRDELLFGELVIINTKIL